MTDEKVLQGETPAEQEAKQTDSAKTSESAEEEVFDKERAMNTIMKLRETESKFKKLTREMERVQEEERKRKEAEMTDVERYKAEAARLEAELNKERYGRMKL
jgi:hypothetical protein